MNNAYTRKKIENYSYGLNDVIGKGYSSHVYRGRNDENSQNVAIKVIDLKMLKNEINRILLDSEIEVLKELKTQAHILTLHDVFTTKNNTYIISELCDSDLSKKVKQGLSEEEASSCMRQIIAGYLNFARKDIIHRDLKPANILMSDGQIKIADFGFAIKVCDAAKSSKYNVGSPLYMAPESLRRN
jgi:serine/threonine-protein kinase ULK/ATG1